MASRFRDRLDAGRHLGGLLQKYAGPDTVVLALPRGGVPVGYQVARSLHAPLDVFVVRKLGVPGHEELAMGAIASGGAKVINDRVTESLHVPGDLVEAVAMREAEELQRRETAYRDGRPAPDLQDKTAILVDDGLATGASMRAAIQALKHHRPKRVVVAVPVAAAETCDAIRPLVDDLVCPMTPDDFYAVGLWYEDFSQTTDDEVRALLAEASSHPA